MKDDVLKKFATLLSDDDFWKIVKNLIEDAERYRWLCKYTSQLFMVTEKQMTDQIDRAMKGK